MSSPALENDHCESWADKSDAEPFLRADSPTTFRKRAVPVLIVRIAISILWLFSVIIAALISKNWAVRSSYELGFETDLDPLKSSIELQKIRFSGGLKFDENGSLYRDVPTGSIQYVGPPSAKIDSAWNTLIHGEGVDLRGKEAESVVGTTYQKPGGWWLTGADVFHQLHCLNMLRQGLHPDIYTHHDPEPEYTMHLDHCIDYLRQSIMCSVDLTPVSVLWSEINARIIPDFEAVHTCRNFEKIHDWSLARDANLHSIT